MSLTLPICRACNRAQVAISAASDVDVTQMTCGACGQVYEWHYESFVMSRGSRPVVQGQFGVETGAIAPHGGGSWGA